MLIVLLNQDMPGIYNQSSQCPHHGKNTKTHITTVTPFDVVKNLLYKRNCF